ncbi:MAG: hypothetical protein ABI910_01460 [Gemmatimonadota bacterium]
MTLDRAIRSLRTRGFASSARLAVESTFDHLFASSRASAHLRVPLEMLRHPKHARHWMADRIKQNNALERRVPWISWPCIDYLNERVRADDRVLEWGGGGSTLFFLQKGCTVVTVESNDYWRERLDSLVSDRERERWELRFVPADSNDATRADEYMSTVDEGAPWNLVLVDGWNRLKCARRAMSTLRPGGLLIFDNADEPQYREVATMLAGWQRLEFSGLGPGRSWATKTDVYRCPG